MNTLDIKFLDWYASRFLEDARALKDGAAKLIKGLSENRQHVLGCIKADLPKHSIWVAFELGSVCYNGTDAEVEYVLAKLDEAARLSMGSVS